MKYRLLGIVNFLVAAITIGTFGIVSLLFFPKLIDFLSKYGQTSLLNNTYIGLLILFVTGVSNVLVGIRLFSKYLDVRGKYFKVSIVLILISIILYMLSVSAIINSPIYKNLPILNS